MVVRVPVRVWDADQIMREGKGDYMNSRLIAACVCGVMMTTSTAWVWAAFEGRTILYTVNASVEATDNRDATEQDKNSNVDVFLRPRIEFRLDSGMTFFSALYEPSLRYRMDAGDDQNEIDLLHRFELALRHALTDRARVRLSNTFLKIEDPRIEEGGAVLRADRSYILNTARVGIDYHLGRVSNLDLSVHNQIRRYDDDLIANLSDKDETGVQLAYRRELLPTLRVLATGAYRMYGYEDDGFRSRDFDTVIGMLGLEYLFTPQVMGSVSAGLQNRSYDDGLFASDDNVYVAAEVSGTLSPDVRMGILAGVGVRDADVFPYPSQEYQEVRGYTDINLTALLVLRMAATYRLSTYDAYPLLGLPGGDEDILVLDAQLTYRLAETISIMCGHRFEDISADDNLSGSFTRNTTRAGVSVSF